MIEVLFTTGVNNLNSIRLSKTDFMRKNSFKLKKKILNIKKHNFSKTTLQKNKVLYFMKTLLCAVNFIFKQS